MMQQTMLSWGKCKRTFLFLYLLFSFLPLFSQNIVNGLKIGGVVVDADGNALPFVTVRLLQADSTFVSGAVTDSTGCYSFSKVMPDARYLLSYSSIGYLPNTLPVSVGQSNIGELRTVLDSDNVMLGEVVVKASAYIRKQDHVLVVPDKQQVRHANTGYDLLYNLMIPNIDVNKRTGEVSTLGGNVTLYINGEKASYRDVQSLRPKDIENVEYYDVPTGKYANDVAAINYITKQQTSGGYVALDGKQTVGYLAGDYNVSAKLNRKQTSYSFWGGYNRKDYSGIRTEKHETIDFADYMVNRDRQTGSGDVRNEQQYLQFKVASKTAKRNVAAYVSLIREHEPRNESYSLLDYSGAYELSEQSAEKRSSENIQPTLNLYGNFALSKKQNLEVSLKGTYAQNDYERTYKEGTESSLTRVDEDMYVFEASGKYNLKLEHGRTLGLWGYHLHRVAFSDYAGDYDSRQHLWSGESLLFLNYTQRIGRKTMLNVSPGYSLLNYKLRGSELMRQHSFRLKMNWTYQISKLQQLVLAANVGNNTPDINSINSVEQTVDFLQIKRGNPQLKNAKIYSGNLVYSGQFGRLNLQSIAVYEFSQNGNFADYFIEGDKLVGTYRSDANVHAFMFQTNLAYRWSDHLRTKLSGGYLHMEIPKLQHLTNNCYYGSFDLNYYWKSLSFNAYANATTDRLGKTLVFAKSPLVYGFSLSWSHKGWYAEAGTENPFTKRSRYKEHADYGVTTVCRPAAFTSRPVI